MSHALAPVGERAGWRGDDFPAWLSPMLVKELRQGIQSGVFAWTFVGLQVVMFLIVAWMLSLVDSGSNIEARGFDVLSWVTLGVAMVAVIPLRGLGAVAAERAGNNLDLVRLTHLSATRIIAGKWLALVAQALLLAVAVLPYLVLRYFLGGVDVVGDLERIGWLLAASTTVAAAAVAFSTLPMWLRIGCCVTAVAGVGPVLAVLDDAGVFRDFGSSASRLAAKLGMVVILAVYTLASLAFAAGRIAPAVENHSARKRLLALTIAAAWACLGCLGTQDAAMVAMLAAGPLLLAYAVGTVVERPVGCASALAPFARRGALGRFLAAFLAPGWATGLLFLALLWTLSMAGWIGLLAGDGGGDDLLIGTTLGCLVAAALVFPVPLLASLPRAKLPLVPYALVQLACVVVFVVSAIVSSTAHRWEESWAWAVTLPFPLAGLLTLVSLMGGGPLAAHSPPFLMASACVILAVLAAVALPWSREAAALGRLLAAAGTRGSS